jgi:hypothetical protein
MKCNQHRQFSVGLRVKDVLLRQALRSPDVKLAGTEEPNQSDDDQIEGDDQVQQPGHEKNENPGDQRNQRCNSQVDIHGGILSSGKVAGKVLGIGFFSDDAPKTISVPCAAAHRGTHCVESAAARERRAPAHGCFDLAAVRQQPGDSA